MHWQGQTASVPPALIAGRLTLLDDDIAQARLVLWSVQAPSFTMSEAATVDEDDSSIVELNGDDASEIGLDLATDPVVTVVVVQLEDGTVPRPVLFIPPHWEPEQHNGMRPFFDVSVAGDVLGLESCDDGGTRAAARVLDPWEATIAGPFDAEDELFGVQGIDTNHLCARGRSLVAPPSRGIERRGPRGLGPRLVVGQPVRRLGRRRGDGRGWQPGGLRGVRRCLRRMVAMPEPDNRRRPQTCEWWVGAPFAFAPTRCAIMRLDVKSSNAVCDS